MNTTFCYYFQYPSLCSCLSKNKPPWFYWQFLVSYLHVLLLHYTVFVSTSNVSCILVDLIRCRLHTDYSFDKLHHVTWKSHIWTYATPLQQTAQVPTPTFFKYITDSFSPRNITLRCNVLRTDGRHDRLTVQYTREIHETWVFFP